MHSVKNIINACGPKLSYLNLASNKIACEGIQLILEELVTNQSLKHLDLGVMKTSQFRNDIGIPGAKALAAFLTRNKTLESLDINDCNVSIEGGEAIGTALAQNHSIKQLKLAENDLYSEGAVQIISNAHHLEVLTLGKNYIKADCGKQIQNLLKRSKTIKKLHLDFNELMISGARCIAQGLLKNTSLEVLNLKGNIIGDQGLINLA